ncbi:MAG: alpha/beta hydrolase [Hyphomonadaceae bacterium]
MKYMPKGALLALVLMFGACSPAPQTASSPEGEAAPTSPAQTARIPYGANIEASGKFSHDGVTFYYEIYGEGEPLLLVHGNGASIGTMGAQIEHFKKTRRVIAMDSRDQGRSGDSTGPYTYETMADDLAALLDHLKVGPVDVVGWSDGGIEALLLGMRHPEKVRKLVAMAANLNPTEEAVYPEVVKLAKDAVDSIPADARATPRGQRALRVVSLLGAQPQIDPAELKQIEAPTLVISGDQDLIRLEHTVEIYNHLPNANLAVVPNSTHALPFDDPVLFDAMVERFLNTPFRRKDRILDVNASFERYQMEQLR